MLKEFLEAVLPAGAPHYAAVFRDRSGGVAQRCVSSIEELTHLLGVYSNKGYDVHFGLAGFTKSWHADPKGRTNTDGTPKQVFRTHDNAHSLKAFWLDVDIARHNTDYQTLVEFVTALKTMCVAIGLPIPTTVSSGAGFHLYWILDRPIYASQWSKLSAIFDAVIKHVGFKADSARTGDLSGSPRAVDTFNWKYGDPKQVKLCTPISTLSPETFAYKIITYAKNNKVTITPKQNTSQLNTRSVAGAITAPQFAEVMGHIATSDVPAADKDPIPVIEGCQQVREAGKESEPVWFSMLAVMRHCEQGEDAARALSRIDPRFTEAEFKDKFSYVASLNGGPTTCEKFNKECADKCNACKHWQKITSPAELGRKPQPLPVAPNNFPCAEFNGASNPQQRRFDYPGKDFKQVPGKGLFAVITDPKDGSTTEQFVSSKCIYMLHAQVHEISFTETVVVYICEVIDSNGKSRQVRFTAKDFKSTQSFREWMVNTQTLVTSGNERYFGAFMQAYLAKLQSSVPQIGIKSNMGWVTSVNQNKERQLGFILGNTLLTSGASPTIVGLDDGVQGHVDKAMGQSGTLEGWKTIPEFYRKHNILWGQVGMCAAFGAVLMYFAPGGATNGVFNFWSPDSGTGKTSLQSAVNSVWGHPKTQRIEMVTTINARYQIMGWRHNLPTCINEVTLMSPQALSEALFQISEGLEKDRKDGNKLQKSGSWDTITIMSANTPALDKLMNFSYGRDAEVKRVLDIEVFKSDISREESLKFDRALEKNYGHAGRIFIQALMERPQLLSGIQKLMDSWIMKHTSTQDERFWISTAAATVIGGKIASAFGLLNFDMDAVEQFILQCITQMRTNVISTKVNDSSLVSDFIADNLRNTLVVMAEKRTTPANPAQSPEVDPYVRHMPTGNLTVRIELDTKTMYVRASAFNDWCTKKNIPARNILRGLAVDGVYVGSSKGDSHKTISLRMGRGVPILDHSPARCYKFVLKSKDSDTVSSIYEGTEAHQLNACGEVEG